MSVPSEKLARLKAMHESAVLLKEGGKPVALLPAFSFTAAGRRETMDLLLVPFEHSGYTTRLFFERKIDDAAATGLNIALWTATGGRHRGTTSPQACRGPKSSATI